MLPVLEELGPKAAGTSYAAAAILALLLAPDRETAFVYLFFGWYAQGKQGRRQGGQHAAQGQGPGAHGTSLYWSL